MSSVLISWSRNDKSMAKQYIYPDDYTTSYDVYGSVMVPLVGRFLLETLYGFDFIDERPTGKPISFNFFHNWNYFWTSPLVPPNHDLTNEFVIAFLIFTGPPNPLWLQ